MNDPVLLSTSLRCSFTLVTNLVKLWRNQKHWQSCRRADLTPAVRPAALAGSWWRDDVTMQLTRPTDTAPVPDETFTHSHLSCSSAILYQHSPSITIHSILTAQFTTSNQVLIGLPLGLEPPLYTAYISSPNISSSSFRTYEGRGNIRQQLQDQVIATFVFVQY